ncbi:zinc finger MYM-type protein 3-like [Branchiostoma lanceolatum]|uniref:zinc finger MYM-type protein 3-like n=1 Tax=Branchiostoma lanceolatum TaxID=7740 RepID=UPI003455CD88
MANFSDQFLEHVGIATDEFHSPTHFLTSFKLEPVDDAALLEHDGISADMFCSQPDPFDKQTHSSGRFAAPISAAIEKKVQARIPKKTKAATRWGKTVWDCWALSRNSQRTVGDINPQDQCHVVPTSLQTTTAAEMNFWLSRFVFEVRRVDGEPYPASSVYGIICGLIRHFREELGSHDVNFLDKKDIRFAEYRKAMTARMKELKAEGVGFEKRQADPLTMEDEDKLWTSGTISTHTSMGLSHGVFFYNCKVFGLRGMDEHRRLQVEQYKFGSDVSGRYIQYTGRISKNVQGD